MVCTCTYSHENHHRSRQFSRLITAPSVNGMCRRILATILCSLKKMKNVSGEITPLNFAHIGSIVSSTSNGDYGTCNDEENGRKRRDSHDSLSNHKGTHHNMFVHLTGCFSLTIHVLLYYISSLNLIFLHKKKEIPKVLFYYFVKTHA
jgi:hypothetical protein